MGQCLLTFTYSISTIKTVEVWSKLTIKTPERRMSAGYVPRFKQKKNQFIPVQ